MTTTPVDPAFPGAYTFVLSLERGWHAGSEADPNPTLDGVTQRTYTAWRKARRLPAQSVRQMTEEERFQIYRQFWEESQAMLLSHVEARMTRIAHFAYFFNTTPKAARQALQRALRVLDDGVIGPLTKAAMATATDADTFPRLLLMQMEQYYLLALKPRLRPNLSAWIGRLVSAWRLP